MRFAGIAIQIECPINTQNPEETECKLVITIHLTPNP